MIEIIYQNIGISILIFTWIICGILVLYKKDTDDFGGALLVSILYGIYKIIMAPIS